MAYDSDEEQIEALKRWWGENGRSLIITVLIVLIVLFGSRQWQSQRVTYAAEASDLYQELVETLTVNTAQEITAENLSTAIFLNDQLKNDYKSSIYAKFASLYMAQLYVRQNELENAEAELSWILDNPELGLFQSADEELFLIARLRLARVILSQGEAQRALNLLMDVEPDEFVGSYAEVEGDAYVLLGQIENARSAYQRATETGVSTVVVELKLHDLSVNEN